MNNYNLIVLYCKLTLCVKFNFHMGVLCVSHSLHSPLALINPRRACAARVTVVVLCVCVSVCLHLFSRYRHQTGS